MCKHCGSHHCHQPHHHQNPTTSAVGTTQCAPDSGCCSSHAEGEGNAGDDDPDGHCHAHAQRQRADTSSERTSIDSVNAHEWGVTGMDCPSCAAKLEKAILATSGVAQAQVMFATEKLRVTYTADAQASTERAVEQAAQKAGFPLVALNQTQPEVTGWKKWRQDALLFGLIAVMMVAWGLHYWSEPLSWALFTLATLVGLAPIVGKAIRLVKSGSPFSIETLMSIAALGALYLGETTEAAMVLVLFLIGERLEGYAASRARDGIQSLMALVPETVTRVHASGERETVAASALQPGDVIEISAGERLPADGQLMGAMASFDQSALTGEPIPVDIEVGDAVMAGSLATDKTVQLTVTSAQGENAIDRILRLIEQAESKKAPIERFIDKFSRWYTPTMIALAALVVVVPPLFFAASWQEWLYRGLALLLIACPCALVISTPAAITSGLATAARRGALIKGGAALEMLASVNAVTFDKTGTLTEGKPTVTDVLTWQGDEKDLLKYATAIERGSHHPLAKSLVLYTAERGIEVPDAHNIQAQAGQGVKGDVDGCRISLIALDRLTDDMLTPNQRHQAGEIAQRGVTVAVVMVEGAPHGLIGWRDTLRGDAKQAVNQLRDLGIHPVMLTGDNPAAAAEIAGELGIDFRAGLLPEDKVHAVEALAKHYRVAMVGDGINDAPAMKAAQLGVAMGSGTDVALETADAALSHNRLTELPGILQLARATQANVRQNITIALGLKGVFLVTSVLGITGLWVAVLADSGATALVTLNALRLLRDKRQ
ncbi:MULTISPECIES: zinc/cadmium/mercury/lead-transporting ATPase [unclassified Salinivibrio]|uniref:zinc/cadmium/mercury/lead-transporting ATPase n=1 Tax=unclassified Salinivibrio TaxID=2636825 RepID=UPI0009854B19|nr:MULTISPECIES: zinc/cadmium/mercury/lead-transporting ATPase [unclassified Salinivibrio]OOF13225.1 zinc/cadmium/mercury/lead-transporting ATPase [Salinivibrio sp. PR919]OOF16031.1 zinc/cadmium/mercury/lead-transporting ATPase [Salinivibrio sp. PR932]